MPTSTRKSIGKVRNRPHIPYRHDDFQHGKRTGMPVDVVDRNSDDFEPFDKVISQADNRSPPRVQERKRRQYVLPPMEEDANGEMSMDIDTTYNSPMTYYSSQRISAAPNSIHRVGSASRPVYHSPDVDYDKLPSPRPSSLSAVSQRQSRLNGKSPGPSRLSQSYVAHRELGDIPSSDDNDDGPPSPSIEHFSFSHMDQDEREAEQIEDSIFSLHKSANKRQSRSRVEDERSESTGHHLKNGRRSVANGRNDEESDEEQRSHRINSMKRNNSRLEEDREDTEEDIVQALNNVEENSDQDPEEDGEAEQGSRRISKHRPRQLSDIVEEPDEQGIEEPQEQEREEEQEPRERPAKSRKRRSMTENVDAQGPKKKSRPVTIVAKGRGRTPLEDVTPDPDVVRLRSVSPDNPEGLRRSRRYRYKPLEYWRLEKVVYGRVDDAPRLVAPIREIVRIPKEQVQPLGGKKSRKWSRAKSKTAEPDILVYNPEEGWDDGTQAQGRVLDYTTKTEVERRIAFTAKMVTPTGTGTFMFQKIFGDGDFIAAGQLIIPPGSEKPSKGTKDNTYVFYVIEGAVSLKIHTTSFVICTGGCFLVPRGNVYYIKNMCSRVARLFFAQARKIPAGEEESHLLPQPPRRSAGEIDRFSNIPPASPSARDDRSAGLRKGAAKRG